MELCTLGRKITFPHGQKFPPPNNRFLSTPLINHIAQLLFNAFNYFSIATFRSRKWCTAPVENAGPSLFTQARPGNGGAVTAAGNAVPPRGGNVSSRAIRFIGVVKRPCVTSMPGERGAGGWSGRGMLSAEARSAEKGVIKFIRSTLTGEH